MDVGVDQPFTIGVGGGYAERPAFLLANITVEMDLPISFSLNVVGTEIALHENSK
jgi:hypothetical protein